MFHSLEADEIIICLLLPYAEFVCKLSNQCYHIPKPITFFSGHINVFMGQKYKSFLKYPYGYKTFYAQLYYFVSTARL